MKVEALKEEESKDDYLLANTADKKLLCVSCDKTFLQKIDLLIHSRIHTVEKPFHCEICNKSFKLKSLLNTHMVAHTSDRPFACEICNRSYRDKVGLNRHNKSAAHLRLLETAKNTSPSNFIDCGAAIIKEENNDMEENDEENTISKEIIDDVTECIPCPVECDSQVNENKNYLFGVDFNAEENEK